jgi:predicted transcriptional regulator
MAFKLNYAKAMSATRCDIGYLAYKNGFSILLLNYLLEHSSNNDNFFKKMTQDDMAWALGVTRSFVSKGLKVLIDANFIVKVRMGNRDGFVINSNVYSKGEESEFARQHKQIVNVATQEQRDRFYFNKNL